MPRHPTSEQILPDPFWGEHNVFTRDLSIIEVIEGFVLMMGESLP